MNDSDARTTAGDEAGLAARGPNTGATGADDQFTGPDEGGIRGENTPYASGYDRQPARDMVTIDAARGHADGWPQQRRRHAPGRPQRLARQ